MSTQMMSDLLVDLSTEQQQLLAGGQRTSEPIDDETDDNEPSDSGTRSRRPRYFIRGIVRLERVR
ncbi:hypothetical protein [Nostoc sp. CALU 1950]|uniref:hypothetical protein n=1 Tax=Nostoc sp. CALU 1950 TaxID=3104321 RepID=UPI003EBCB037